jgi:hypothetical protein
MYHTLARSQQQIEDAYTREFVCDADFSVLLWQGLINDGYRPIMHLDCFINCCLCGISLSAARCIISTRAQCASVLLLLQHYYVSRSRGCCRPASLCQFLITRRAHYRFMATLASSVHGSSFSSPRPLSPNCHSPVGELPI